MLRPLRGSQPAGRGARAGRGRCRALGFLNVPLEAGRRSSRLGSQRGVGGRRGSRQRRALGRRLPPPASRQPSASCPLERACLRRTQLRVPAAWTPGTPATPKCPDRVRPDRAWVGVGRGRVTGSPELSARGAPVAVAVIDGSGRGVEGDTEAAPAPRAVMDRGSSRRASGPPSRTSGSDPGSQAASGAAGDKSPRPIGHFPGRPPGPGGSRRRRPRGRGEGCPGRTDRRTRAVLTTLLAWYTPRFEFRALALSHAKGKEGEVSGLPTMGGEG